MTENELDAVNAAADYDEDWTKAAERQEAMAQMTPEVLSAHLSLLGWYPVAATRAALQRGCERVYIIELPSKDRTTVGCYSHPDLLVRDGVPWKDVPVPYLRLLANRIARLQR